MPGWEDSDGISETNGKTSDDDAGSLASFDGRQNDLVARPSDAGALALAELSGAAVRDPLQLMTLFYRKNNAG